RRVSPQRLVCPLAADRANLLDQTDLFTRDRTEVALLARAVEDSLRQPPAPGAVAARDLLGGVQDEQPLVGIRKITGTVVTVGRLVEPVEQLDGRDPRDLGVAGGRVGEDKRQARGRAEVGGAERSLP